MRKTYHTVGKNHWYCNTGTFLNYSFKNRVAEINHPVSLIILYISLLAD